MLRLLLLAACAACAGGAAVAQGALQWRWSHPEPHGNNVADLAFKGGRYFHVTEYGGFYSTTNLAFWTRQTSGTDRDLRSIAFLGERLLVTGEEGAAFWSDDGVVLSPGTVTPATTDWLEGVAAGVDSAVAVGDNGAIYRSTDGRAWQRVAEGRFQAWLSSVAWGGGRYVAVGENGFVATSEDGADWTVRTSGTRSNLWRVVYGDGEFVAVGSGGVVLVSSNGVSWAKSEANTSEALYGAAAAPSERAAVGVASVLLKRGREPWKDQTSPLNSSAPAPPWNYSAVIWDGGRYVAAGRTGVFIESFRTNAPGLENDTLWFRGDDSARNSLWSIERLGTVTLAVGELATVLSSTGGGAGWELESVPLTNFPTFYGIAGTSERAVVVGSQGTILLSTNRSTDLLVTNNVPVGGRTVEWVTAQRVDLLGIDWTRVGVGVTTNTLQGVAWNGREFLAVGTGGLVAQSPDGVGWRAGQVPLRTASLTGVTPHASGWVVSGSSGALLTSVDGSTWVDRSLGVTNWVYRVRDVGDALVAVGQGGLMWVSRDGTTWEPRAFPAEIWLTDARRVGASVFICGTRGRIWRSTDLVTWEQVPTPTGKAFYGLAADRGWLFAAGTEGIVLRARAEVVPASIGLHRHDRDSSGVFDLFQLEGSPESPFRLQGAGDFQWVTEGSLELDVDGVAVFGRETVEPWRFYRTAVP